MNASEYSNMVTMLTNVTSYRLLKWNVVESGYTTKVGECTITLSTDYDTSVNVNEYTLTLYNANGERFETFNFNESDSEYSQLDSLYKAIRDSIYHITESEESIMKTLKDLSSKIPDDELPF